MYRTCEVLDKEPLEIGRIQAYADGWIENGSIYLHMEYKWLLELLRKGLHRQFYEDLEATLIPFLDPGVYGRSILEGSSYIVSSGFPDQRLHCRGFQPRLSGMTTEVLHMWTVMVAGESPFSLNEEGQLTLQFRTILPGWLFTSDESTCSFYDFQDGWRNIVVPKNAFAFKFLGTTLVVYHNTDRSDTYGRPGARVSTYALEYYDGSTKTVEGAVLKAPVALDVREDRVRRIDAFLFR